MIVSTVDQVDFLHKKVTKPDIFLRIKKKKKIDAGGDDELFFFFTWPNIAVY